MAFAASFLLLRWLLFLPPLLLWKQDLVLYSEVDVDAIWKRPPP